MPYPTDWLRTTTESRRGNLPLTVGNMNRKLKLMIQKRLGKKHDAWPLRAFSLLALLIFNLSAPATQLFNGSILPSNVNDLGYNDAGLDFRIAENFSFSSPVILNQITFLGGYYSSGTPLTDSFTLTIYNHNAALNVPNPSSVIAQSLLADIDRVDTGVSTAHGNRLYQYTATFTDLPLSSGTTYWLSIVNDTSNDPDDDWVWAGRHQTGIFFGRSFDDGHNWDASPGSFSFSLAGAVVPEPSSFSLTVLGCLFLMFFRKRAR
jgi:hypothetical protein